MQEDWDRVGMHHHLAPSMIHDLMSSLEVSPESAGHEQCAKKKEFPHVGCLFEKVGCDLGVAEVCPHEPTELHSACRIALEYVAKARFPSKSDSRGIGRRAPARFVAACFRAEKELGLDLGRSSRVD